MPRWASIANSQSTCRGCPHTVIKIRLGRHLRVLRPLAAIQGDLARRAPCGNLALANGSARVNISRDLNVGGLSTITMPRSATSGGRKADLSVRLVIGHEQLGFRPPAAVSLGK